MYVFGRGYLEQVRDLVCSWRRSVAREGRVGLEVCWRLGRPLYVEGQLRWFVVGCVLQGSLRPSFRGARSFSGQVREKLASGAQKSCSANTTTTTDEQTSRQGVARTRHGAAGMVNS